MSLVSMGGRRRHIGQQFVKHKLRRSLRLRSCRPVRNDTARTSSGAMPEDVVRLVMSNVLPRAWVTDLLID